MFKNVDKSPGEQALREAENHIQEACEILKREAGRLRRQQESIESMTKKMQSVHFASSIKLDVGDHYFKTSLQTLTKDPDSMLAAMFSGRFQTKPSEDGAYFIDRDGTHFRFILNYLRTGELTLPDGATFLNELEKEAEFYQLQGVLDQLRPKVREGFEESEILTEKAHRRLLLNWIGPKDGDWRILFRASRDGWGARDFHSRCDGKGPTVTIVRSGGNIFGGFTDQSWLSTRRAPMGFSGTLIKDRQAFLFSMVNPSGLEPTKMATRVDKIAIVCDSIYGPTFGRGPDLKIAHNANTSGESCSSLGVSYQHPEGQFRQEGFFTGSGYFSVTDYEVFGLHQ